MATPDKREQLYSNLIGSGKVTEAEIGNKNEFRNAIKDESSARAFYQNLIGSKIFNEDDLGSEDDFYGSISSDFATDGAQTDNSVQPQQKKPYKTTFDMQAYENQVDKNGISNKTKDEQARMNPWGVPAAKQPANQKEISQSLMQKQAVTERVKQEFFAPQQNGVPNWFTDVAPKQRGVEVAERERAAAREEYDAQNFEGFYQSGVKPVFEEEKIAAEQRYKQTVEENKPFLDMALRASGNDPSTAMAIAARYPVYRERETDPEKVTKNVIEKSDLSGYALGRMGFDTNGSETGGESAPMSEQEKRLFNELYGKEIVEVAEKVQQRMYQDYIDAGVPKSDAEYILGKAFHDSMIANLGKAIIARAAGTKNLREQFRAQAYQKYGEDAAWYTKMAGSVAPLAVDVATGGFAIPSLAGKGAAEGATSLLTRKLASKAAERVGTEAATRAASRYIATNSPLTNLAFRSLGSAANFGTFETQGAIIQQLGTGKFDPAAIGKAFLHGAALGGVMGAAGGAIGNLTKNASLAGKVAGYGSEIAAETGIFAADKAIEKAKEDGVSILDVDWASITGEALGMVLGFKLMGAGELRKRFAKSPDYDLKLNSRDVKDLEAAGYDFRNIFKGMDEVGKMMPLTKNVEIGAYEPNKGKVRGEENKEIEVDADELLKMLRDSELNADTKRKLFYLATGKVVAPESVFKSEMEINEDGSATVFDYNIEGKISGIKEFDDVREADKYQRQSQAKAKDNAISIALNTFGLAEDVEAHAKKMTNEKFGIDIDDILKKEPKDRTEEEKAIIGDYVKTWEDLSMNVLRSVKLQSDVESSIQEGQELLESNVKLIEDGSKPVGLHEAVLDEAEATEALMNVEGGEQLKASIDGMLESGASNGEIAEMMSGMEPAAAKAANDYIQAKAKNKGVDIQTENNVQSAVEAESDRISQFVYNDEGESYLIPVTYRGRNGYAVAFEGENVVVKFEDNGEEKIFLDSDEDLNVGNTQTVQQYMDNYTQLTQNEVAGAVEAARVNNPRTKVEPQVGDVIDTTGGQKRVASITDGKVYLEEPLDTMDKEGNIVPKHPATFSPEDIVTPEEFVRMQNEFYDGEDRAAKDAEKAVEEEAVANVENEEVAPVEQPQPVEEKSGDEMPMMEVTDKKSGAVKQKPDFATAGAERSYNYIYNERGLKRNDANAFVNNNLEAAQKKLEALQGKPVKMGTDLDEFEERKSKWQADVDAAQKDVDMWQNIKKLAKDDMLEQQREEAEAAKANKKVSELSEPLSMREWIMRALFNGGYKFDWDDDGDTKGLGSHLGFSNSKIEKRKRRWMIGKRNEGALSPEKMAERMLNAYATDMGWEGTEGDWAVTSQDVLNELLDIVASNDRKSEMGNKIVQEHNEAETTLQTAGGEEVMSKEEEEYLKETFAKEMGFTSYDEYESYLGYAESDQQVLDDAEWNELKTQFAEEYEKESVSLQQNEQLNTEDNGEGTNLEGNEGSSVVVPETGQAGAEGNAAGNEGQGSIQEAGSESAGNLSQGEGTGSGVSYDYKVGDEFDILNDWGQRGKVKVISVDGDHIVVDIDGYGESDFEKGELDKFRNQAEQEKTNKKTIQGLENYEPDEVLNAIRGDVEIALDEAGLDGVVIKDMAIIGSRMRGDADEDSDLDVLLEYEGDISEDALFNILHETPIEIEGINVDINPITKGKSGTIAEFLKRNAAYDEEKRAEADNKLYERLDALSTEELLRIAKEKEDKAGDLEKIFDEDREYDLIGYILNERGVKLPQFEPKSEPLSETDPLKRAEQIEAQNEPATTDFENETMEEWQAFEKRVPKMSDEELLGYIEAQGEKDYQAAHSSVYDEYDERHRDEYLERVDYYKSVLDDMFDGVESGAEDEVLERVNEMQANAQLQWEDGGYYSPERTALLAQMDAINEWIDEFMNREQEPLDDYNPVHRAEQVIEREKVDAAAQKIKDDSLLKSEVDVERARNLRQALADAYAAKDPAAIKNAIDAIKAYRDEGLDFEQDYNEAVDDYEGDNPMMLADKYIIHAYQDVYLDDDEDQEYIKTGLTKQMRGEAAPAPADAYAKVRSMMDKLTPAYKAWNQSILDDKKDESIWKKYDAARKNVNNALKELTDKELEGIEEAFGEDYTGVLRERVEEEQRRRVKYGEVDNAFVEGLAEQGKVTGKAKETKPNVEGFAATDDLRPALNGVYYDPDGYAVASDGKILIADKTQFDKKNSGKIVLGHKFGDKKKGDVLTGATYPKWKMVIPSTEGMNAATVNFGDIRNFLAGAEDVLKAQWNQEKEEGRNTGSFNKWSEDAVVGVRMPNGEVCVYSYPKLKMFADAAQRLGMKEVYYGTESPIYAENKNGVLLLMPMAPDTLTNSIRDGKKVYYEWNGKVTSRPLDVVGEKKAVSPLQMDLFSDIDFEEENADTNTSVQNEGVTEPTQIRLRPLEEGESSYVERRYVENGFFDFTGTDKIESIDDVAYIFKQLQNASVENSFVVLVKDGVPTVIHVGMGTYMEAPFDGRQALVAYRNINPDKVYMVHNHPSGKLKCSKYDRELYAYMRDLYGEKLGKGIIIDTTSGKYGLFGDNADLESRFIVKPNNEIKPLKVYSFSKAVFAPDWDPDYAFKMFTSADAAKFISSHRLGKHEKLSLLIVNNNNNITGNVFLPWTSLKEAATKEGAELISYYMNQMGGNYVVVYGSARDSQDKRNTKKLQRLLDRRKCHLIDFVRVAETPSGYESMAENGAMEPEAEFGTKPEAKEDEYFNAYNNEQGTVNKQGGLVKNDAAERSMSPYWRGALHALGRLIGRRVVVLSGEDIAKMGYAPKSTKGLTVGNSIYLNEEKFAGDAEKLAFLHGHEITHILKKENPELWNAYVEAVKVVMGKAFTEEFTHKRLVYDAFYDAYNRRHPKTPLKKLTDAQIEEEICCDWSGRNVLTDEEAVKRIIENAEEAGADPVSLTQKILDYIKQWIADLKQALKNAVGNKEEISKNLDLAEKAKKLWQDMYNVAVARQNAKMESLDEYDPVRRANQIENRKADNKERFSLEEGKKNTAFNGSTGQIRTDATSGGLVRSAHNIPTDTQGVPSDAAKVQKNTQSTTKKIKDFHNGDFKIDYTGNFQSDAKALRDLFGLKYEGGTNYAVYNTPKGRLAFRLGNHNAFGDNFKRDNAKQNISVYVALNEYNQPSSDVKFTEYKITPEDYEAHADEFIKSLVDSVDGALRTGDFEQPAYTEKVVDNGQPKFSLDDSLEKFQAKDKDVELENLKGDGLHNEDEYYLHGKLPKFFNGIPKDSPLRYSSCDIVSTKGDEISASHDSYGNIRVEVPESMLKGEGDTKTLKLSDIRDVVADEIGKLYEDNAVRFSLDEENVREEKRDSEESKKVFDAAKKLFGVTQDIREAGYVLPDGSMLDFSGRHLLDKGSDSSFLRGRRTTDHREISSIAYESDGWTKTGLETSMPDFIERGAIRIDDNAGTINLFMKPTNKQKEALRRLVARNDGDVTVDFGNGWDTEHDVEYTGAKPVRVLSDIDKYFDEGIKPESDVAMFSLDDNEPFYSNAEKAVTDIKQEKATPEQWLKMIEKNGGLKAGEDKWLGLSDWLKSSDAKTLTKQEVLDYIQKNEIRLWDVNYSTGADWETSPKMIELRDEFDKIADEKKKEADALEEEANAFNDEMFEKYGLGWANDPDRLSEEDQKRNDEIVERWNNITIDQYKAAYNEMVEKYGEDFEQAFEVDGGILNPVFDYYDDSLSEAARYYLDMDENPINGTRLNYTTEGLDNKKEIALVVPNIEPWNVNDEIHFGDAGGGRAVAWVRFGDTTTNAKGGVSSTAIMDELEKKYDNVDDYSKMTDEDAAKRAFANYLVRDNADVDMMKQWLAEDVGEDRAENVISLFDKLVNDNKKGQRVLVIDEIQSKRHQEGREQGYYETGKYEKSLNEFQSYIKRMREIYGEHTLPSRWTEEEQEEYDRLRVENDRDYDEKRKGIPSAPFDKNWHELAMKRMLRYAAENGYDKVAWTKGEQQAERYDLSQELDKLSIRKNADGTYNVEGIRKGSDELERFESNVPEENLANVVGKDIAKQAIEYNGVRFELEGDGLRIGGEGMKGFYDQILPRFMDKYGKKWGVKTGEVTLPNLEKSAQKMWSVDVTPEMKESVMQGQPMFSLADEALDEYDPVKRAEQVMKRERVAKVRGKFDELSKKYNGKKYDAIPYKGLSDEALLDVLGAKGELRRSAIEEMEDVRKYFDDERKKSFYNPFTDKILIFADRIKEGGEEEAFFHENVHGILQDWYGEGRRSIAERFWDAAPDEGLSKKEFVKKNYHRDLWKEELFTHWLGKAMVKGRVDEVLNLLNKEDKQRVNNILNILGYDKEEENARRAEENGAGLAEQAGVLRRGRGESDADSEQVMFSLDESEPSYTPANAAYEQAVMDTGNMSFIQAVKDRTIFRRIRNKFAESYFDYSRALKQLQNAIEQSLGRKLTGYENAWQALNAKSSVDNIEIQQVMLHLIAPISEHIGKNILNKKLDGKSISMDDVEAYLNAVHGIERNQRMAERMAEENENSVNDNRRDFAGLTSLFTNDGEKNVSIEEIEKRAKEYADRFEDAIGKENADELWKLVKALNDFSLQKSYNTGLISKEQLEEYQKMYEHYVPLRGWHDNYAGDVYQYISRGESPHILQSVIKKAYGRKSRAGNIFGTMASMANSAIVQGNKNLVKQKFWLLANGEAKNTGLLMTGDSWYEQNANGEWVPSYVEGFRDDMTPEEMRAVIEAHEKKMRDLEQSDKAKRFRRKFSKAFPLNMAKWQEQKHAVRVLVGGREHLVYVLGNPRAAMALNGLMNEDSVNDVGWVSQKVMQLMRFNAKMQTSLSPEFMISNFQRDCLTALGGTYTKYGWKSAGQFVKNLTKIMPLNRLAVKGEDGLYGGGIFTLIKRYRHGTLDMSDKMQLYFEEFCNNGGITGVSMITSEKDYEQKMAAMAKRIGRGKGDIPLQTWEAISEGVEFVNSGIENATRFAAYMTSRQAGKSVSDSIFDAKEVSVNFNMKGSGAWGNLWVRRYILYANPALQALRMIGTWYGASPKRFLGGMATILASSLITAFINSLLSAGGDDGDDNDNDWWKLSEWNRYNYINIKMPFMDGYLHYSLPQEYRPLWAMGQVAFDWYHGKITEERALKSMLVQMNNLSPMAFFEGGLDTKDSIYKTLIKAFTPTVVGSFANAYLWNENFMGQRITNQGTWNEKAPEWQRAGKETPRWMVDLSKTWNEVTGGRENKKSWWDSPALNPSAISYIITQQFGGIGSMLTRLNRLLDQVRDPDYDENEFDWRNVPFIPKFYVGTKDAFSKDRVLNDKFWMYWNEFQDADYELRKDARNVEEGEMEQSEADKTIEARKNDGSYLRWELITKMGYDKTYDKVRKLGDKSKETEMKKKIVDLIELQQTEGFDGLFNSTEDSDERKIWGTAIAKEYGVEDSYGKNPSSTWSKVTQNSYYNYQRSRSAMDVREDSKFLKMQKDAEKSGKTGIAKGIDKARTGLRYTWKALNGDPRNDEKVMDGMRKARRKAMKDIQDVIDRTE